MSSPGHARGSRRPVIGVNSFNREKLMAKGLSPTIRLCILALAGSGALQVQAQPVSLTDLQNQIAASVT